MPGTPDAEDLDRFGIDPEVSYAAHVLGAARWLSEHGATDEEIGAAVRAGDVTVRAWRKIFGTDGRTVTLDEAAKRTGLEPEQIRRVLGALGLPEPSGSSAVTADDILVLELFADVVALIGEDSAVHLARAIGSSVGRMADAATSSMRVNLESPLLQESSYEDFLRVGGSISADLLPRLSHAIDRILRHQILLISSQSWALDPAGSATTMERTIGFADVVGFTPSSAGLSMTALAEVVDTFEGRVTEVITTNDGRVVKFIGDEVMFSHTEPDGACRCALELVALAADSSIPDVRVGLAHGPVMSRYGDYYGPVVNLAARLVSVATPREILVTAELADVAGDAFAFEPREPVLLKGIEHPVEHMALC